MVRQDSQRPGSRSRSVHIQALRSALDFALVVMVTAMALVTSLALFAQRYANAIWIKVKEKDGNSIIR
jgi:hypothetical protein